MAGVPVQQFAYKTGHSAVNAVDLLGAEIDEGRRKRMTTVVIALDITKAFDSVWTKGLVYKIYYLPIESEIKAIIANFMNERVARVQVGKEHSSFFRIERGVPQGSKLGPVLYSIYTGDFKVQITERQGLINFADDSLLWTCEKNVKRAVKIVEKNFEELASQMEEWGIEVNRRKTKCLIVTGGRKKRKFEKRKIKLAMNGEILEIENDTNIKYLGQIINEQANCKDTVENGIRKGRAAFGMLRWLLKDKNMDMKVKKLMYTQLIRPTMEYGQEAWRGRKESKAKLEEMEGLERKILRSMTGLYRRDSGKWYSNKELYKAAQIEENITEHMEKNAGKYEERKDCHRNEWFRKMMEDLFQRKVRMRMRNEEYNKTTAEWKMKWKETGM